MAKKILIVIYLIGSFFLPVSSQESPKPLVLNGYVTTLQSVMFDSLSGTFLNENLLHNRLNFKGYFGNRLTLSAEIRNRLFTGDMVRLGSFYTAMIGADDGWFDMSWNVVEKQSFLFNTTVDRLWIDFHSGIFQLTAGRQRINWGQAFVWNPNDLFNAYSFFDFDYAERPGSDAIRFQVFPSPSAAAELAVKVNSEEEVTVAGLYRFNRRGYDIQFLAGIVDGSDIVIGTGWSGAIGSLSFRGEASWFDPYRDFPGKESTVMATAGMDKIFKDNSMAQLQILVCNEPIELNDFNNFYTGSLSAKDLAFSRFSAFGQFTWSITPLLNMTVSAMWFPDLEGFFAGPSLDYSLAENLDFSLLWQHFDALMGGSHSRINLGFLRLKYSY